MELFAILSTFNIMLHLSDNYILSLIVPKEKFTF